MGEKNKEAYTRLIALIPEGKENGVSRRELAEALGFEERAVSTLILRARRNNIIIASGNSGYYRPRNLGEAEEYYNRLHSMAVTILTSLIPVRKELKEAGMIKGKRGK